MTKQFEQFDPFRAPRSTGRNTVNGVPVDLLDGHLPPPVDCPECGFPIWLLHAPDSVTAGTGQRRSTMMGWCEYAPSIPQCKALTCRHPYHLVPHQGEACRRGRPEPVFPAGLLVRPPRIGEVNDGSRRNQT